MDLQRRSDEEVVNNLSTYIEKGDFDEAALCFKEILKRKIILEGQILSVQNYPQD